MRVLAACLLEHGDREEAWTLTRQVLRNALQEAPPTLAIDETLQVLGTIEVSRGRPQVALRHMERALEIALARTGSLSDPTAACLNNIAIARWSLGQHERALDSMRQARAITEHLHGPKSRQTTETSLGLARLLGATGAVFEAEALLRRVLEHHAADDPIHVRTLALLGELLARSGRTPP